MKTIFGTEIKNPTKEQVDLMQKQLDLAQKSIKDNAKFRDISVVAIIVVVVLLASLGIAMSL